MYNVIKVSHGDRVVKATLEARIDAEVIAWEMHMEDKLTHGDHEVSYEVEAT